MMKWKSYSLCVLAALPINLALAMEENTAFSEPYAPLNEAALTAVQTHLPPQWQPIALASGPLNQDEHPDYAVLLEKIILPPAPAHEGGLHSAENPRHILILLSDQAADTFTQQRYSHIIPKPDSDQPDTLAHIGIVENSFEIRFTRRPASDYGKDNKSLSITLNFTLPKEGEDKALQLSRWQRYSVSRRSGLFDETIIDLEASTQEKTSGSMSSPRHKKSQTAFESEQTWGVDAISDPFEFVPGEL